MRNFTDAEVIARVEGLSSFDGWKKGLYDVAIRSKADEFDSFDDKSFLYEVSIENAAPVFLLAQNVTTNAGSFGLKHFDTYNHLGCAVLKSDWMVYNSHQYGLHKGKPAYRQIRPFPYFRDANKNEKAEEIGPEYHEAIGANIHRAGQNSTVIKNWSTACIVTSNLTKFLRFLQLMKQRGHPLLTLAILKEW